MVRVAVFAPNGGLDLAYGGGTFTALGMASALSEAGNDVLLCSIQGMDKARLELEHGVSIDSRVAISRIYDVPANGLKRLPFIVSLALTRKLVDRVRIFGPDVAVFNDDAPNSIFRQMRKFGLPLILYAHFSNWVRTFYPTLFFSSTVATSFEAFSSIIPARRMLARMSDFDLVLCNSLVTAHFVDRFVKGVPMKVVHPPVLETPDGVDQPKQPIILHTGRQDKTFMHEELLHAALDLERHVPQIDVRVVNPSARVYSKNKPPNLLILPHLSKDEYLNQMKDARYLAHFKRFEGFGISVAEAMSYGCIPLVYASTYNAAWTDIVAFGKFGIGFSSCGQFVEKVRDLESNEDLRLHFAELAFQRSRDFSMETFKQSLTSALAPFLR